MKIGQKLKDAREKSSLTQEDVAEKIGVSRQTISNWETERTYPDIISVIKLSDLYQISLDELLKGDRKMLEHLDESTNIVKSNRKLIFWVVINILVIVVSGIAGVVTDGDNTMILGLIFMAVVVSVFMLLWQIIKRI